MMSRQPSPYLTMELMNSISQAYDVKDNGTYAYDADSQTLTITDANGKETKSEADGDNVKFHYEYSESDQLTGDFTVEAAALADALK